MMRATVVAALAAFVIVAASVVGAQAQASPIAVSEFRVDLVQFSVSALVLTLIGLFWRASKDGLSCLDLITDKGSGKISLTKVLNLVGGVVGVWTVMRMAIDRTLTTEIFGLFLLYCAGTHGFSTYLSAKYGPGEAPKPAAAEEAPKP